jgi:NhaA family Na+:H+ antiporter
MVDFFGLVGIEIRRELLHQSTLGRRCCPHMPPPVAMAVPALIYAAVAWEDSVAPRGWAVPTATDVVLAVSVLAVLGPRMPAPCLPT